MALTYLHAVASLDGYSEHAVVVSHRPKPAGWHPEASYHFASSVEEGIGLAQDLAGDGEIGVTAGDLGGGQALALGLIDRVTIDVVPTVFGHGKRYFGGFSHGPLLLGDPDVVVRGSGSCTSASRSVADREPSGRGPARGCRLGSVACSTWH